MKKIAGLILIILFMGSFTACEDDNGSINNPINNNDSSDQLSQQEMNKGLKEALKTGTKRAVDTLNQENGYFGDKAVKILFPPEVQQVEQELRSIGAGDLVDDFVKKLNRAAEDAAGKATPIFVNAVKNITFQDARNILEGTDTAATHFFRENTADELFRTFKPDIEESLDEVGAQTAWNDVTSQYNQLPFVDPVETDLARYTTEEALDGLFLKLKKEEKQIREDPIARTKAILEKVFSQFEEE